VEATASSYVVLPAAMCSVRGFSPHGAGLKTRDNVCTNSPCSPDTLPLFNRHLL